MNDEKRLNKENLIKSNIDLSDDKNVVNKKVNISSSASSYDDINDETLITAKKAREEGIDIIDALDHLDKEDELKDKKNENSLITKINSIFSEKHIFKIIMCFIIIMVIAIPLIIKSQTINVSITINNEKTYKVKNVGKITTADAIKKAGITTESKDVISKPLDEVLNNGDEIDITSASRVFVTNGNKVYKVSTGLTKDTDILKQAGFTIDKNKKISKLNYDNVSIYALLNKNQKLEKKYKTVKSKTIYKQVKTLNGKDEKVLQKGNNGKLIYISVVTKNKKGKVVSKKNLTKTVEKKAKNKIVAVAQDSKNLITFSNGSKPVKYSQKITVTCTAYCGCSICCGKSTGITASGTKATANRTIAAWSGLAFGTKVYFPSLKGNSNGGIYTVEDRGGAINSGRIDIYFSSHSQALAFGRRTMVAYILK